MRGSGTNPKFVTPRPGSGVKGRVAMWAVCSAKPDESHDVRCTTTCTTPGFQPRAHPRYTNTWHCAGKHRLMDVPDTVTSVSCSHRTYKRSVFPNMIFLIFACFQGLLGCAPRPRVPCPGDVAVGTEARGHGTDATWPMSPHTQSFLCGAIHPHSGQGRRASAGLAPNKDAVLDLRAVRINRTQVGHKVHIVAPDDSSAAEHEPFTLWATRGREAS